MIEVRQFLEGKLQEAHKERLPLEAQATHLRARLADIDVRVKQLLKVERDLGRALQVLGKSERATANITIKDAILAALADAPHGLTSSELVATLNEKYFDGSLQRTSMSPQLTRLKNKDRKIRSKGDRYVLA